MPLIVGQPVVISVDVQRAGDQVDGPIPHMPGFGGRLEPGFRSWWVYERS